MNSKMTLFLLAFLILVGNVNSYSNAVKIDSPRVSNLSNATVQCNTEVPVPLVNTATTFDNLTTSSSTSGLCLLGCGISNVSNLTDSSLTNYATVSTLLGVGVTHNLRVTDTNDDFVAGTFAGFRIDPSGALLSVELLNNISIKTYLNGVLRETTTGSSLLNLALLANPDNYILGFNTNLSFDAIEISINSLAGVTTSTNVYYAVIRNYCAGPALACNMPTAFNLPAFPAAVVNSHTGLSGVSVGSISNPENAVSSSATDYAGLNLLVGVLGSASLAIKDQVTDYPVGTYAGFEIENINLVSVSALSNVKITTYLNGVQKEQFWGTNLLVNGTLLNATGRYKLGFVSTTAFDEVQISVNQTAGVSLGLTKVYSSVFEKFCVGPDLPCNTPMAINTPTYPVFINGVKTGVDGLVCALCSVSNSENLIDENAMNHANVDLTASVGTSAKISVKDQITDYPAGTFAGFDIESIALLNANVFDAIRITTYLNGVQRETKIGNGPLISVNTNIFIGTGRQSIGFISTMSFDEVQITLTNLATVTLGTVKVYSAVLERFCPTTVECNKTYPLTSPIFPVTIDGAKSGINGVACVACAINNVNNVLTANTTDFANITLTASVLVSGSIAVADQLFTYPAGTYAGFTIKDINNLIETDLFQSLTISTYNNGVLRETKTGAQLLSLSLLTPVFGSGPGFYNVGFKATLSFDEIQIRVASLASVISNVNVYGAFVNTKDSDDGGAGSLNCNSSDLRILKTVSNATPPVGSNVTFTIVATNAGPRDADGVVVNDILPTGYMYISSTVSTGNYNNATGVWTIGNLSNAANATLTITAKVNVTGNFANTATITGNQPDPNLGNNTSTSTPTPVNVIIAQDDTINGGNGTTGNPNAGNVLNNNGNGNDTLNGNNIVIAQVNLTVTTPATPVGGNPVPVINPSTGQISIPAGTPAGPYILVYQICEKLNPTNCDSATVTVTVSPPAIVAQDDTISGGNGTAGNPNAGNVLNNNGSGNDTLNGSNAAIAQVNLTVTTPATPVGGNPVPVINPSTGQISIPVGTPAGPYTLVYQICEKLNPANCDYGTVTVTVSPPAIVAQDDTINGGNGTAGNPNAGNVLNNNGSGNDTLSGSNATIAQVNLTVTTPATPIGGNPVPVINTSTGQISIPAGTPAGPYTLVYKICEKLNPTNCDSARVTVTVSPPAIVAQDDTISGGNGTAGNPNAGNVLNNNGNGNDTLSGSNATIAQVNLTVTTPATSIGGNPVPVIDPSTGQISIPAGTPAGPYTLVYKICEKLNPTNCDSATVTVTVSPPTVVAQDDTINGGNGTTGNPNAGNVLNNNGNGNDTLNGSNVVIAQVNLTVTTPATSIGGNPVPVINPSTGQISIPAGTPAGPYTLVYKICEKLNPTNCDSATVTVTVSRPAIVAVDDTAAPISTSGGTAFTNVLGNDTLNGQPVVASQVNTTFISSTNSGIMLSGVNVTVAPNTPPGPYTLTYQICEKLNSTNCDQAVVSVTVFCEQIAAPTASVIAQPTCTLATGTITVTSPASGAGISYTVTGTNPVVAAQSNTSGVFSGLAPGVYSVTTSRSGCTSTAISLTVNPQPATPTSPTASVTAQPTCTLATGTITISSPVPGTGISYTVTGTNPVVAAQSNTSGVFSGLVSGVYSVTTSKSGCTSAAISLTVNPQPVAPVQPTLSAVTQSTCTNANGSFTITNYNASYIYVISPSTGVNVSGNTIIAPAATYTVTAKLGSCTSVASASVTINAQPTICNVAGIFHTVVTCTDYRNNASNQLIGQLCYTTKSNKVANVTPGQFFYFTSITAPSASFCVDIVETKSSSDLALFTIQQSNQITLYNANCSSVASGTQVSLGLGRVCISNAIPGTQYVLAVKYDSKSIVSSTFTGTAPVCKYSFECRINGVIVSGSSTSIDLVPNCSVTTAKIVDATANKSTEPDMVVSLAPNPSLNDFGLDIKSLSDEHITIRIIDINGRLIRQFKSTPKETVRFGSELSKGLYFIEVIQGDKRKVVKAQKL